MIKSEAVVFGNSEKTLAQREDSLERQVQERTDALRESEAAQRDNEVWLAAQKEAFQAALNGATLEASLEILVRAAVAQWSTGTRCAFYIANAEGTELHHVSGMSESYAACVDGFRIAADSLAC